MDVSSVVNSVELKGMKLVDLKAAEWVGSWAVCWAFLRADRMAVTSVDLKAVEWVGSWAVCWAFLRADRRAAMMAVLMAVLTAERKDVK